jgi:hypothetical protein
LIIDEIKLLTHENDNKRKQIDHKKMSIEKQVKEFNETKLVWLKNLEQ